MRISGVHHRDPQMRRELLRCLLTLTADDFRAAGRLLLQGNHTATSAAHAAQFLSIDMQLRVLLDPPPRSR